MNSTDSDQTHVSVGFRISGRRGNVISQVEAVLNSLKAQEKAQEQIPLEATCAAAQTRSSSARRQRKRERDRERMRKLRALARAAKAERDGEQTLPGAETAEQETKR